MKYIDVIKSKKEAINTWMYLLLFKVNHSFHISKVELKEEKVYSWGVANESRTILSLTYLKSIVFHYYF